MPRRDPRDWVARWVEQADEACLPFGGDPWIGGWFHLLALAGSAWFLFLVELAQIVWED